MLNYIAQININIQELANKQQIPGASVSDPDKGFALLIGQWLQIAIVIAALVLLLYLIWGGIEWITSGGDKGKVEKARNRITQAVIGVIVLSASTAIFMLVQNFLGIDVLKFNSLSKQPPRTTRY